MSNYLTPRQIEVYERLIKKLLYSPNIACFARVDWSEEEWNLLNVIAQEIEEEKGLHEVVTSSWMASHVRGLLDEAAKAASPASEKESSHSTTAFQIASKRLIQLVQEHGASRSPHRLMMDFVGTSEYRAIAKESRWMLAAQFKIAMEMYYMSHIAEVEAFIEGQPDMRGF